jgi:hypothetical protein
MTVSGRTPILAKMKVASIAAKRLGIRAFDQIETNSPNAMNARTMAAA